MRRRTKHKVQFSLDCVNQLTIFILAMDGSTRLDVASFLINISLIACPIYSAAAPITASPALFSRSLPMLSMLPLKKL